MRKPDCNTFKEIQRYVYVSTVGDGTVAQP